MDRSLPARRRHAALVGALLTLAACGGSGDRARPRPCPRISAVDAALLPARVPLGTWGTITEVSERAGFIGAEAVSDELIVVLYPKIVTAMRERGYTLLGGDNEGFEAEITLSDRRGRLTTFTLRQGRCDQVILRTLVETAKEQG